MQTLLIIIFLVVIFCAISILYAYSYNEFQENIIRINEAEVEIDSLLRKRYDLLNKSNDVIKEFIECDEKFDMVGSSRNLKLDNFELNKKLNDSIKSFKSYKKENEEIIKNEQFIKIDVALNATEAELIASRNYYNDVIKKYNNLVGKLPYKLVASTCKYKSKAFYDI